MHHDDGEAASDEIIAGIPELRIRVKDCLDPDPYSIQKILKHVGSLPILEGYWIRTKQMLGIKLKSVTN